MQIFRKKLNHPYISQITSNDLVDVAKMHAANFNRGWSKMELQRLLAAESTYGFVVREEGKPDQNPLGFVICREALDEAEILSVATDNRYRGMGIGRALMDAVVRHLQSNRMQSLYLEVDENNVHAVSLYKKIGFRIAGRRDGYYSNNRQPGSPVSALVMRLPLV